ncbi:LCP family protein [Pannus brasiliensis CCIBt3594]|uniref:LCP family protein n=1 Tax=Pannus brasiliensis CCIBt3594 TaxID=1427578 RepID=A0AAW9QPV9_9CHRO
MTNVSGRFETQKSGNNTENTVAVTSPDMNRKKISSAVKKGLFWGVTLGFTAVTSATIGAVVALMTPLPAPIGAIFQKTHFQAKTSILEDRAWNSLLNQKLSRPVNILVMGIDRVLDAKTTDDLFKGRSDTMLLVRFEPADNTVRVLSIPRDSRVRIPDHGFTKINDANVFGGPALATRVVSRTLGDVQIDRYARITTDAFKELVDLVGGVDVYVPEKMYHKDVTQKLEINLEEGWQNLDGDRAEQFARYRNKQTGDIGRVQRQQILLKALQQKLFSPTILPSLPGAVQILQKYIDTNLTVEEMLALAHFGLNVKREDVRMVLLPGRFNALSEFDGRSYWILNREQIREIVRKNFTDTTTGEETSIAELRIAVQNATNTNGMARKMRNYLVKQGYTNAYIGDDSHEKLSETQIIVQKGDFPSAKTLKSQLGIGTVEASSIGALDSDLTVRVGEDAIRFLDEH